VRGLRTFFALDAVETEFVHEEEIPARVSSEGVVEALVGEGSGELDEHLGGGRVPV